MGGFVFGPPPPEMQAEIQRQQDLQNMEAEASQRMFEDLVESLDEEKLTTLKGMMTATISSGRDNTYALHALGWINSRLKYRFGVCMACGEKHEEIPTTEGEPGEQPQG